MKNIMTTKRPLELLHMDELFAISHNKLKQLDRSTCMRQTGTHILIKRSMRDGNNERA